MSKHKYWIGLAAALAGLTHVPAPAQTALSASELEQRNLKAGKLRQLNGIQENILPNGLVVLTKEVHAAPVVYFDVAYKVGSVNEVVGQTGMSHLMEHMMFKGTKSRGPGVISATLQKNGADFNASTFYDRTEYHETLAADRLELAMQIESDRMVNSLYDETQHQKEMSVVRSEFEGDFNDPGYYLGFATRLAAYQVHPYRWQTIGFRSDIENFSRDEMYAYYKNYYAPNNAVVTIVGDFDTPKALALVNKYFGGIKAHPITQHYITPEPPQDGERRLVVHRAGTVPQIAIYYHAPGIESADRYPLAVLGNVLSGGRTARFFGDLIQSGLAASANAGEDGFRDPDLFQITAVAQLGHTNAELEKALLDEVTKLQTAPISQEELTRTINQYEAYLIFARESVQAQGSQISEASMTGDWRYNETLLANIRKVTAADVQRVAQKYLMANNRTVGYFEPITSAGATKADGHAWKGSGTVTSLRAASAAQPVRKVLDNGITVIVEENHANPTVSVSGALLSAGGVFDPQDKPGLAEFTASQLSRGTEKRSLLDIAKALENVGASANVGGGEEYVSLSGAALVKDFPLVLDILSDELRHPAFPADEFKKAQSQSLAGIEQARQDTGTLARIAFAEALYPKGHPYYQPSLDTQSATLKALTPDDLRQFWAAHYGPDKMILTIVGDVKADDAIAAVQKYFGDWPKKGNLSAINIPDTALPSGSAKPIVVQVPDKTQVDVVYGYPGGLKRSDPDFYAVEVMNTILGGGGGLSSRLAVSVRDTMGLVYGIYSYPSASLGQGPYTIAFGSNPANADKAIAEEQRQITLFRDKGATKQEVADAITNITGSYPVTLSTNGSVAGALLGSEIYGLGLDYIQRHNKLYEAVTPEQVNAAAKKYLNPDAGALVISGTYTGKYAGK